MSDEVAITDGELWTATIMHLLGLVTFAIVPLGVYFLTDSEFVRDNANNALQWQLMMFPVGAQFIGVTAYLFLKGHVEIGIFVAFHAFIWLAGHLIFPLSAAYKAKSGYRASYPFSFV